ncbi:MAG TPA: CBS domain-containing protein [Acidimicrobiia bacterium]|jgi:CBS domain-containing protein
MEIRSLVAGTAVTCPVDTGIRTAAGIMKREDIGSIAVMDGDTLVGILTERDVLHAAAHSSHLETEQVQTWMSPRPDLVSADADVEEAVMWMLATGHRHLPVVDHGGLVGIVSIKDVLWAITEGAGHKRPNFEPTY